MRQSILLASALVVVSHASPSYPNLNVAAALPGSEQSVSDYFNLLAEKVQQSRLLPSAPVCDLSKANLPENTPALPPPTEGSTLKHVAIGRGTQNYTCDTTNATAIPVSVGALASLFNASCVAALYPDLLNMMTGVALNFNFTSDSDNYIDSTSQPRTLAPTNLALSGHHYFNGTVPYFDLNAAPQWQVGTLPCAKNSSSPAPTTATKGYKGENAVAWLRLVARPGATGDLHEVYRVQTAGGNAPATCVGQPASFTVQYAAQYWFYSKDS